MCNKYIFSFKKDISRVKICSELNNPFGLEISEIANVAAKEFQEFLALESQEWGYDFDVQRGKMFGVLVVQKKDNTYSYLGTVSGKLPGNATCERFIPSVFDDSAGDFFINKGMQELAEIGKEIKKANNESEIKVLVEKRAKKSIALQQRLFENYRFLNLSGLEKNVLQIFKDSSHGNPPSAAGECTAPKLLNYAFKQELKPIALAEFWWGKLANSLKREHQFFYPACKNKCRPILEYMLDDTQLFDQANTP